MKNRFISILFVQIVVHRLVVFIELHKYGKQMAQMTATATMIIIVVELIVSLLIPKYTTLTLR